MQVYEYNIRIHMLVRGPGIAPNSTFDFLATNVDVRPVPFRLGRGPPPCSHPLLLCTQVAPTFLGLAGLPKPPGMDGKSVLPLLLNKEDPRVPPATRAHLHGTGCPRKYQDAWRDSVFVEYYYGAGWRVLFWPV